MVNLFRAEWRKIVGNRPVALMLVWIYPIGAAVIMALAILAALLSEEVRSATRNAPQPWTAISVSAWSAINNSIGRILLLILTAYLFAGEYQWGTWKNIIPRTSRSRLLIAKFIALGVFIIIGYGSMTLIAALGSIIINSIAGAAILPPLNDTAALGTFARDYLISAFLALSLALVAACFTAIGGMATRSIIGGIVVGVLLTFADEALAGVLFVIGGLIPSLAGLFTVYYFMPSYNMGNISSIIMTGQPFRQFTMLPEQFTVITHSLETSVLIMVIWLVVLIGLIFFLFRRQDILG
jgi:ABC-type transport system involved in multi-copper enzyme maturation permease subunit